MTGGLLDLPFLCLRKPGGLSSHSLTFDIGMMLNVCMRSPRAGRVLTQLVATMTDPIVLAEIECPACDVELRDGEHFPDRLSRLVLVDTYIVLPASEDAHGTLDAFLAAVASEVLP